MQLIIVLILSRCCLLLLPLFWTEVPLRSARCAFEQLGHVPFLELPQFHI